MIVEERTYRIVAGKLPDYLKAYEEMGLEIQKRILGNLIGYFSTEIGELSSIVHLWGYASLDDRQARRLALGREATWQAYLRVCTPMLLKMETVSSCLHRSRRFAESGHRG
jgi:hypothetical protein